MNNKILVQKIISEHGGIAKAEELVSAGISHYDLAKLCKNGIIERIRRGLYQLPQNAPIADERLIREMLPQGIICVESALFHYCYSDFAPRRWSVAVPRTASRTVKHIQEIPLKAYFIQKDFFELGKITDNFNGVPLAVYDRERTICDCFKYRTKLDNELFNKAINAYVIDDKKNLAHLSRYAKEMRLYTKMMNVMEVLLGG